MTFYSALQLDPAVLKKHIRESEHSKEKGFYSLAIITRAVLLVAFAIAFISVLTHFFDKANSPMAVVIFCILLSVRFVNFNYCLMDSLLTLAITFALLLFAPMAAASASPLLAALIHLSALLAIVFMTSQQPEMGNGGLYGFAYVYLSGTLVSGDVFIDRAWMALVGYLICAAVFIVKHRHQHRKVRFHHTAVHFSFQNKNFRWQCRLALGVSLVLTLGQAFNISSYMWMGFACSSLLATFPYSEGEFTRFQQRLIGVVIGCSLFYIVCHLLPTSLFMLLGPIGGLALGFCSDYRSKTALNCFGALMIATSIYGLNGAVILRLYDTLLGAIFAVFIIALYHFFIESKPRPLPIFMERNGQS